MHSKLRRLVPSREIAELLLGTASAQILTFLFLPVVSRAYAPVDYGIFAFYNSISAIISVTLTLRLEQVIPLAKGEFELNRLVASLVKITVTLFFACLVFSIPAFFILKKFEPDLLYEGLVLALIVAITGAAILAFNFLAIRTNQLRLNSIGRLLVAIINPLAAVAFAYLWGAAYDGLFCGLILANLLTLSYLSYKINIDWKQVFKNIRTKGVLSQTLLAHKKTIVFNLPGAILDYVQEYGIIFLLAFLYPPEKVGLYSFAYRIVKAPIMLLVGSYGQVIYKVASSATDFTELRKKLSKFVLQLAVIAIIAPIFFFLVGPKIFGVLFGERWIESGVLSGYLAIWLFSTLLSAPFTSLFFVFHRQETALILLVASFVSQCIILFVGEEIFQFTTVLLFFGVSAAFWSLVNFLFLWRLLKKRGAVQGYIGKA